MTDFHAEERRAFERRPDDELRRVQRALQLHPWLNTPRETARLEAVKKLLKERK